MLKFEPKQLHAFAETAFTRRMCEVLRMLRPEGKMAHDCVIDKDIAEQLKRAREHGFTEERDCARWVLCAWCLGKDFDHKIASIAELLKREDVGASYKSLALELILRSLFAALAGHSRAMP
jgi:hypothetical protein